jgi:hypothetical protein
MGKGDFERWVEQCFVRAYGLSGLSTPPPPEPSPLFVPDFEPPWARKMTAAAAPAPAMMPIFANWLEPLDWRGVVQALWVWDRW